MYSDKKVIVVIPCYMVSNKILQVINEIPKYIDKIVCIDDKCPQNSGKKILNKFSKKKKVVVLFNKSNLGVGGATMKGYIYAKKKNADIIIKIDGDGQMCIKDFKNFLDKLIKKKGDYIKGNRLTKKSDFKKMPKIRLVGNLILSYLSRLTSGYWNIFDFTCGFVCFNSTILDKINLKKISKDYFFEIDFINNLYFARTKIEDVKTKIIYNDEKSNLKIHKVIFPFLYKMFKNFFKRIIYFHIKKFNIYFFFILSFLFLSLITLYNLLEQKLFITLTQTQNLLILLMTIILLIFSLQRFIYYDKKLVPKNNKYSKLNERFH